MLFKIIHLWQFKMVIFIQRCLIVTVPLLKAMSMSLMQSYFTHFTTLMATSPTRDQCYKTFFLVTY
jgi:hypothetical protein